MADEQPIIIEQAPFPWFGGKSRAAGAIWQRLGNVPNYVEPFAGSLAVLLRRPHAPGIETVNDIDAYLSNVWRAIAGDPDAVAHYADWPVNEADLHARHNWLLGREAFRQRMRTDPDYYDAKIAGWWVWGQCAWIGSGWCDSRCYYDAETEEGGVHRPSQQIPHLGGDRSMHRPSQKLPHLSRGQGVHRPSQQLPHLSRGNGVHRPGTATDIYGYMQALSARLRGVRVCCGDWTRVLGPSPTYKLGLTGILLDPPYDMDERDAGVYAHDRPGIARDVREWAIANGDNPLLRIALCGYDTEHGEHMPDGWTTYRWKAHGGYARNANGDSRGKDNAHRETIWFSPHCLPEQTAPTLFDMDEL